MPATSTLSLSLGNPGSQTFSSSNLTFAAIDPPSWLTFVQTGIDLLGPSADYEYTVIGIVAPGVYTIYISESDHYITITITGTADFEYTMCLGEYGSEYITGSEVGPWSIVPLSPAWAEILDGPIDDVTVSWAPTTVGVHYFAIGFYNEETEAWEEVITFKVTVTNCHDSFGSCLERYMNIVWFLPGSSYGWRSFLFGGVKTYGVEIGGSETHKDENGDLSLTSVLDVRDGVNVASGQIRQSDLEYVKSIRYSIAVYVWVSSTNTFRKIIVEKGSFTKRKDDDNLFTYRFSFVYADEIKVQHA